MKYEIKMKDACFAKVEYHPRTSDEACYKTKFFFHEKISSIGMKNKLSRGNIQNRPILQSML